MERGDHAGAGHRPLAQSRSPEQGLGLSTAVAAHDSRGLLAGSSGGYAPANLGGGRGVPEGAPDMTSGLPVTSAGPGLDTASTVPGCSGAARHGDAGIDFGAGSGHGSPAGMGGAGGPGTSPSASPSTASATLPKPIRRRMRMITSCLECRRRKLKCNKSTPCTNCQKFGRECVYFGPKLDEANQLKLTQIKEKVGSLERQLERDIVHKSSRPTGNGVFYQQRFLADEIGDDDDEERGLEITPMVALDVTYEEDDDEYGGIPDEVIDLGIQVGRMRITERIGGLNRPRLSEELSAGLSGGGPGRSPPSQQAGALPNRPSPPSDYAPDPEAELPDFLRPSPAYMVPTGGFFFGQILATPSLEGFLPRRDAADRLLQQYFDAVHPVARCVHRPTFEQQYQSFWEDAILGHEPRPSIQALMFAAWFSALVSMGEDAVLQEYKRPKKVLVDHMKMGVETALSKANFLRTTKFDTMQAFVMYMIPLCRAEVSRAHSVLVGAAVRMAECMGLHRDGETYNLAPLETHVRRLVWHQLCFLDIRTCEAQGPRPAIRREDYDTKLPVNCEEDQLTHAVAHPQPAERWTTTLLPLVRFEINEMMRIIWMDRRRLEVRRTTLTAVLAKVESFRKRMLDKYNRFLDDQVPIQKYTKLVMHLLLCRLHAMVLHPYHANTANPMPPRLNSVLVMSGIMIIEISIQLETDALFKQWAWYLGAYQQFQIALLLATEVYYRPNNKEVDRIWACLDYVFYMDRRSTREEKGMQILHEIMSKTARYSTYRKMRAPNDVAKAVPERDAIKSDAGTPPFGSAAGVSNLAPSPAEQAQAQAQTAAAYQHAHTMNNPMTVPNMKVEPGSSAMPGVQMQHQQAQMQGVVVPPPPTEQQRLYYEDQWQNHMQMTGQNPMHPRAPSNAVFGGVNSRGEPLWGFGPPAGQGIPPTHPDQGGYGGNVPERQAMRQQQGVPQMQTPPQQDYQLQQEQLPPDLPQIGAEAQAGIMDNIDWETLSSLFPYDPQTGELGITGFTDPALGMKWS